MAGSSLSTPGVWAAHEKYVATHGLSELLSDALTAVLQEQPRDPAAFLAMHFSGSQQQVPRSPGPGIVDQNEDSAAMLTQTPTALAPLATAPSAAALARP